MEEELRKHRCCFTGHRPEKLNASEDLIVAALEKEILLAIESGFTTFISGMARGVDIWAAEIVLKLRDSGLDIKLICASPYPGFENNWSENWKQRYLHIMRRTNLIRFISKHYSRSCFQMRNQWMVDHSSRIIAVYNGSVGGTKNTIDYANSKKIPVFTIQF